MATVSLALRLFRQNWCGEATLITHVASLPGAEYTFPGPYPFFDLVLPN